MTQSARYFMRWHGGFFFLQYGFFYAGGDWGVYFISFYFILFFLFYFFFQRYCHSLDRHGLTFIFCAYAAACFWFFRKNRVLSFLPHPPTHPTSSSFLVWIQLFFLFLLFTPSPPLPSWSLFPSQKKNTTTSRSRSSVASVALMNRSNHNSLQIKKKRCGT